MSPHFHTSFILFLSSFIFASLGSVLGPERSKLIGTRVTLDYGIFNGFTNALTDITYFRGVRYADAPIGNLRWRAPVSPPTKHLGEVNATQFGDTCIETTQATVTEGTSEDCLFGNVYIPMNTRVGDDLPVMVWFHGGGFEAGNTHTAPPELIMQSSSKPLIFVSFEYRLGQFGFLGGTEISEDGVLNAGLLDQRTALKWVQNYIHLFGGDKSQVTIWGESAGAGSTMFHLMANGGDNQGLFRAAMGDSPSLSFMPLFNQSYDQDIFDQFGTFAGCGNDTNALSCLRSASSETLTRAGSQLILSRPATLYMFAPILDGTLMQQRPVEAFNSGKFAQVPVLFGSNTNEGAIWSSSIADPNANTSMPNATEATVFNFLHGQYASFTQDSYQRALEAYPLADYENSFSLQGQQMYGEARYICTSGLVSGSASKFQKAYRFHYNNPHLGANHGAELDAFFSPPTDSNAEDLSLFETMREFWTSFVTTGVPTAKKSVTWKPVTDNSGSPRMLLQPGNVGMEPFDDNLAARCSLWRDLSVEMQT
ncbi:alpha/beta-hydrolase [Pholiota conissans]|uniref:Carboxylic ester hydrolase n=1 Tax=Pholiota conissans TaxID=109636 RepID=A0A9P5YQK0_9AGAR|nr:alpha/beta-hydrolase [Pholiota conissans]